MSTDQQTTQTADLAWFKSSYSGTNGGDCVEVATTPNAIYVRDSKTAGNGPILRVDRAQWAAFVAHTAS
ncbi:DUF397 domain-containing protein [Streptomyces sp. HPF1205]|uniref:DUF397 domain-containing protein n=1 Tax=Streptomyces sp. HPF1205 TaxID=2873262 RepID=UPI001CEC294A|nr:DUF397 domain-containing protein [Streptomyces sp. HPF1205]